MVYKVRLVHGVGVNDSGKPVRALNESTGKIEMCPFYSRWASLLMRVHCAKFHVKRPTYKECSVSEDWLVLSNFKSWMEKQDWEGKVLDKDLLIRGNKLYSEDTCLFVSMTVNNFISEGGSPTKRNGQGLPLGVHRHDNTTKFSARSNDLKGVNKHLGMFALPEEAHEAYIDYKRGLVKELALLQTEIRVRDALLRFYD